MIKKSLLLCSLLMLTMGLFAQEVEEVQRSLITKKTATWCPHCGSWGWDFFKNVISDNQDNAIYLGAHYSGDLENSVASGIINNFGGSGQPLFYLNRENQVVSSGNASTKRQSIKDAIDANAANAPIANTGMIAFLNGNTIQINSLTKFFQDADGEFHLGIYLVEDDVFATQAGHNPSPTEHPKILRAEASNQAFGTQIVNGNQSAGDEITMTHELTLASGWNVDKMEMVAIIWKREGNSYEFVNGQIITEFSTPTSVQENLLAENSLTIQPNISTTNTLATIKLETAQSAVQLAIYNQQGQLVQTIFSGNLNAGQHSFDIKYPAQGLYMVHLRTSEGIRTKQVVFN